jgi:hypothetical protein
MVAVVTKSVRFPLSEDLAPLTAKEAAERGFLPPDFDEALDKAVEAVRMSDQ